MKKVIIDADTGSDDAVALLMAYRNLAKENILGVTLVSGNVPLDQAVLNTIYVNELCEVDIPIYKGANKPLNREYLEVFDSKTATNIALSYTNESTSAQHVHGIDGLGDIGLSPINKEVEAKTADEFYKEVLENETDLEIVTLGPLTMGGSSNALGNVTKFAEYNFWVDPEAADIVLNAGIPTTMIGWDPSLYDAMIDINKINEIESLNTKFSKFTNDIQVVLREMMKELLNQDAYDLPDPLAMSVFLDETIISQSVEANVRVDVRDGMTRGGCVIDYMNIEPETHKTRIVQRCNPDKFFELLKSSLV